LKPNCLVDLEHEDGSTLYHWIHRYHTERKDKNSWCENWATWRGNADNHNVQWRSCYQQFGNTEVEIDLVERGEATSGVRAPQFSFWLDLGEPIGLWSFPLFLFLFYFYFEFPGLCSCVFLPRKTWAPLYSYKLFWSRLCRSHKALSAHVRMSSKMMMHSDRWILDIDDPSTPISRSMHLRQMSSIKEKRKHCRPRTPVARLFLERYYLSSSQPAATFRSWKCTAIQGL
jgi:hypothetical protein